MLRSWFLIWSFAFSLVPLSLHPASPKTLFVDAVRGDDANNGTELDHAFATINRARDVIREKGLNKNMAGDLVVFLRSGRYELSHTIVLDERDSGSNGHTVIYRAYQDERPIICGGRRVTGWHTVPGKSYLSAPVPAHPLIPLAKNPEFTPYPSHNQPPAYDLHVPDPKQGFARFFGQLYVNGIRAERARSHTTMASKAQVWWDDPTTPESRDGVIVRDISIKAYTNVRDIRLMWLQEFKSADVPVERILPGDAGETIIQLRQPEFYLSSAWIKHINTSSEFFIVNALEELDEPGEWYLDQAKRIVYYYPFQRDGDLEHVEVMAPTVEYLLRIDGTPAQSVSNIRIEGVTFQHGNWTESKDHYLGMSQAEIFDTYKREIPGQIIIDYAHDIAIVGCTIRHMGSCGIQLYEGCRDVLIEGNLCYDTTGAGISIGRWWNDERECPPESVCTNITVRNNIVRNTGRDYWQATGINLFAVSNCEVSHNDISDTAYTALHARIGDRGFVHPRIGKLAYRYNKVSRAFAGHKWGMGDGGHLYMHGRYPDSIVSENYSLHANRNVNFEYYADNWSYKTVWQDNVSDRTQAEKPYYAWHHGNLDVVFRGNFSDKPSESVGNAQKDDFHLIQNGAWPERARRIMREAGLEPHWQHRADTIYGHENLAAGKLTRASSEAGSAQMASAASDENWNSFWASAPDANGPAWWQVDLGEPHVIQKITILPRQDTHDPAAQSRLEVQASNDPDFSKHIVLAERGDLPWYRKSGPGRSSNEWEVFLPPLESYRYVRVVKSDTRGALSLAEFGVFGFKAKDRQPVH